MLQRFNRKWRLMVALLASFVFFWGWMPGAVWAETAEQIEEVRQIILQHHLNKPSADSLNQDSIDAIVESLNDPYTEYYSDEEWESFFTDLEMQFTGIGIKIIEADGVVYVEDTIPGGPAEAAGLLPGDALTFADGEELLGLSVQEIQQRLLGKEGTKVEVGVTRDGQVLTFPITRGKIQLPVASSQMMGEGVGYLALTGFTSEAGEIFARELSKLEEAGMNSLIIDLRNNGGGYVNEAREIASLFIKEGVLAHLKDRNGLVSSIDVGGGGKSYPVTVLINGGSASASELLAGALQDYRIAKLIGTRTFGKGLVQTMVPLNSGGVIKFTIQEYVTPKGRQVDQEGLAPDMEIAGSGEQLIEAFRSAGGTQVEVRFDRGSVVINEVRTAFPNALVVSDGKPYIHLRLLASIAGAQVGYDAQTGTVLLEHQGQTHELPRGDERLINKNGWNMIELTSAIRLLPNLTADTKTGPIKITIRSR